MNNEVVKYHNDINKISFGNFKEKELDLFFSICFKLKEQGTDQIMLNFSELKDLIGENKNPKRLKTYIDNLNKKLAMINHQIEIEKNVFERFVLFTNIRTDFNKKILIVKVNEQFSYTLNNLIATYTKFDLMEFVSLKSSYSKNTFKLLKQWESKRNRTFKIEEFKELLGIPESYKMSVIDSRVIKPIITELPQYFKNLKLEKIKTGRKISHLKFTWEKDIKKIKDVQKIELEIMETLNNIIEQARKNRFLSQILTDKNIYKLTEMYEENQLKKGLKYIYKIVKKEVPSFAYLLRIIETGIEEQEIEIKIKDNKKEFINQGQNKIEKNFLEEEDPIYAMFLEATEEEKEPVIKKAKERYIKEIGVEELTGMYVKFFEKSKRSIIIKILKGE
ncbi:Initiator Replication protein [Cetobacterium ceti]|uniref:Initiator Replication protein n=1 Tax=Cetobacterium ceti TaxID=180163 RepID=A0A1T4QTA1_9FUSO|nr:replication initiation protein [Cetobacterium ceti]SKA06982.1 Initiator Replication protein [Cetobacterium ceti]